MSKQRYVWVVLVVMFMCFPNVSLANYPYEGSCPPANSYVDDMWGFFQCECVSYVAWELNQFANRPESDPLFHNHYYVDPLSWGSAYLWRDRVDETFAHFSSQPVYYESSNPWKPYGSINQFVFNASAAVAWWDNGPSPLDYGHVAFVEHVTWNENHTEVASIVVSEYNWSTAHGPGVRTLTPNGGGYPDGFLYIVTDTFQECGDTCLCPSEDVIGECEGECGGGDPSSSLNLKIDFDIMEAGSDENELIAGQNILHIGMPVDLRVEVCAEGDDAEDWMEEGKDQIEIDYYVRIGSASWFKVGRGYMHADKLDKGDCLTETFSYLIPDTQGQTISFKAIIDAEYEARENNEDDNISRIETFTVQNSSQADLTKWLIPIINNLLTKPK